MIGSTLTLNVSEPGRIGILIDSTESIPASGTPKCWLYITFEIAGGAGETTSLSFTDTQSALSNERADPLSARYRDGVVKIGAEQK